MKFQMGKDVNMSIQLSLYGKIVMFHIYGLDHTFTPPHTEGYPTSTKIVVMGHATIPPLLDCDISFFMV